MSDPRHIVLGVTGSIAAYKSADLVRRISERGYRVSIVMTREAGHFIAPMTLAALSGGKVYDDLFETKHDGGHMPHISLARQADAIVIAPATANILGKMALGLADDLLTNIILATESPIIVAPAMNHVMYRNPAVQENCARLKARGIHFADPSEGSLACGEYGVGHLADVDSILGLMEVVLKGKGRSS